MEKKTSTDVKKDTEMDFKIPTGLPPKRGQKRIREENLTRNSVSVINENTVTGKRHSTRQTVNLDATSDFAAGWTPYKKVAKNVAEKQRQQGNAKKKSARERRQNKRTPKTDVIVEESPALSLKSTTLGLNTEDSPRNSLDVDQQSNPQLEHGISSKKQSSQITVIEDQIDETSRQKICKTCGSVVQTATYGDHLRECLKQKFERKPKQDWSKSDTPSTSKRQCVLCQVCQDDIGHLSLDSQQRHINDCLDKTLPDSRLSVGRNHEESDNNTTEVATDSQLSTCQFCGKDLKYLNSTRRSQHVNRCMDKDEAEKKKKLEAVAAIEKAKHKILDCPLCGKSLKAQKSRQLHLKKCANQLNITPSVLRERVHQQETEYQLQLETGILPDLPTAPHNRRRRGRDTNPRNTDRHTNSSTDSGTNVQRMLEEPGSKWDEETQLALALSESLQEETTSKSRNSLADHVVVETKNGDDEEPGTSKDGPITTDGKNAFSILMSPKPKEKGPRKRKKKNSPEKVYRLTAETDENRTRNLESKISNILLSQECDTVVLTPSFPESLTQEKTDITKERSKLWSVDTQAGVKLSSGDEDETKQAFYVEDLQDRIVPSDVKMGSKIKKMSYIPGWKPVNPEDVSVLHAREAKLNVTSIAEQSMFVSTQTAFLLAELADDAGDAVSRLDDTTADQISIMDQTLNQQQAGLNLTHRQNKTVHFAESSDMNSDNKDGFARNVPAMSDNSKIDVKQNNSRLNLISDLEKLITDPIDGDFIIVCKGNVNVPVHSLFLAIRCPALLEAANGKQRINLPSHNPCAVQSMLKYIYAGSLDVDPGVAMEVKMLSEMFNLPELTEACRQIGFNRIPTCVNDGDDNKSELPAESPHVLVDKTLQNLLHDVWGSESESDSDSNSNKENPTIYDTSKHVNQDDKDLEELYEFAASQRKLNKTESETSYESELENDDDSFRDINCSSNSNGFKNIPTIETALLQKLEESFIVENHEKGCLSETSVANYSAHSSGLSLAPVALIMGGNESDSTEDRESTGNKIHTRRSNSPSSDSIISINSDQFEHREKENRKERTLSPVHTIRDSTIDNISDFHHSDFKTPNNCRLSTAHQRDETTPDLFNGSPETISGNRILESSSHSYSANHSSSCDSIDDKTVHDFPDKIPDYSPPNSCDDKDTSDINTPVKPGNSFSDKLNSCITSPGEDLFISFDSPSRFSEGEVLADEDHDAGFGTLTHSSSVGQCLSLNQTGPNLLGGEMSSDELFDLSSESESDIKSSGNLKLLDIDPPEKSTNKSKSCSSTEKYKSFDQCKKKKTKQKNDSMDLSSNSPTSSQGGSVTDNSDNKMESERSDLITKKSASSLKNLNPRSYPKRKRSQKSHEVSVCSSDEENNTAHTNKWPRRSATLLNSRNTKPDTSNKATKTQILHDNLPLSPENRNSSGHSSPIFNRSSITKSQHNLTCSVSMSAKNSNSDSDVEKVIDLTLEDHEDDDDDVDDEEEDEGGIPPEDNSGSRTGDTIGKISLEALESPMDESIVTAIPNRKYLENTCIGTCMDESIDDVNLIQLDGSPEKLHATNPDDLAGYSKATAAPLDPREDELTTKITDVTSDPDEDVWADFDDVGMGMNQDFTCLPSSNPGTSSSPVMYDVKKHFKFATQVENSRILSTDVISSAKSSNNSYKQHIENISNSQTATKSQNKRSSSQTAQSSYKTYSPPKPSKKTLLPKHSSVDEDNKDLNAVPEILEVSYADPPTDMDTDISMALHDADDSALWRIDNDPGIQIEQAKTPVAQIASKAKSKKNKKAWVPPSPFTPMPTYDAMITPNLKKACQKYGVRVLPKKKMIVMLKDIYKQTHQYETDSEYDGTPLKTCPKLITSDDGSISSALQAIPSKSKPKSVQGQQQIKPKKGQGQKANAKLKLKDADGQTSCKIVKGGVGNSRGKKNKDFVEADVCLEEMLADNRDDLDVSSCSQDSNVSASDVPEESMLIPEEKLNKRDVAYKRQQIWEFIKTNPDLYLQMVHYEPLDFISFHQQLKDSECSVGAGVIMDLLDDQNVQFTMKNVQASRWKKKAKKKGIAASQSQR